MVDSEFVLVPDVKGFGGPNLVKIVEFDPDNDELAFEVVIDFVVFDSDIIVTGE